MKLKAETLEQVQPFLDSFLIGTLVRGRKHLADGEVRALECITPDEHYSAVVGKYWLEMTHTKEGWAAECSCPVRVSCKHIVAAMLELQQRALAAGRPGVPGVSKAPGSGDPHGGGSTKVRQPPRSPVCDRLVAHLGRELRHDEAHFIRQIQTSFAEARSRALTGADLALLSGRSAAHSYSVHDHWRPVQLWQELPADDWQFWLLVAWELRRRNWSPPPFMGSITDLTLIEPVINAWERQRAIEHWKARFQNFEGQAPPSDPGVLEVRLAIGDHDARLHWRMNPDGPFSEMKQAQARRLAREFEQGLLSVEARSLPLWSATYKPWHYGEWWVFGYGDSTARPTLSRLLRMPLAPDHVVLANGSPLPRPPEPLRLTLRPPGEAGGDYELSLVAPDGQPAPRVLCTLKGCPTLYLTEHGLFSGPRAELPGADAVQRIPAPALETTDGLRFLHNAGVALPEHLAPRVKTVPVRVVVACELAPLNPTASSEEIVIRVTATAPGIGEELLSQRGWDRKPAPRPDTSAGTDEGGILIHDRGVQRHFPRVLETLEGLKCSAYDATWRLRLTRKTPEVFVSWLKSLPSEVEVKLDRDLATLREDPLVGSVSLDVAESDIDWFDLKVALNVSDTTLTRAELKLLLNARGGYVRLENKGWKRLQWDLTPEDDAQLARLGLDARDFSSEPQRLHALQLANDAAKRFLPPERVEKIERRVSELKLRVAPPLPPTIRAELRPYQTEGFHFLAYLVANGFGGVLADDMGLGKTLQTLTWLAWLRHGNPSSESSAVTGEPVRPSLVVCPKSVMDNWRAEAARFYPGLRVIVWRGEDAASLQKARETSDLVVLNYAQLRSLSPDIAGISWGAVVLDEAQYIKNPDSQTAQAARALKAGHRLALTGTPIENRLLDLWSIMGFAMPGALGPRAHFLRRFDGKEDPLARRRLAARVRPFLLRRTKSQVARDLPDRVEEDLLCELEGPQKTLYRAELKRARRLLLGLKTHKQLNAERFNILTSLLRLRQICCHPALVDGKLAGAESAKVSALEDLLEPLMEEGHKVLVFSQFVTMLELLRQTVQRRQWLQLYLAGHTENRGELVEKFQSTKGGAVFLLSLKAGGFGLNLTAASYVVLFDPWWNPAVENQAIDRTHRIGQSSKVMAYRLLVRDSIEEKIRALQKKKAALADDVLGEERFTESLTLDDLRFLFAE
jgi:hypothetical protein